MSILEKMLFADLFLCQIFHYKHYFQSFRLQINFLSFLFTGVRVMWPLQGSTAPSSYNLGDALPENGTAPPKVVGCCCQRMSASPKSSPGSPQWLHAYKPGAALGQDVSQKFAWIPFTSTTPILRNP